MFLMDQKVICLSCCPHYPLLMLTAAALSLRQCPAAGPPSDYCHCPQGLVLDSGAPCGVFSISAPDAYISHGSSVAGETAEGAVTLWGRWQVSVLVLQKGGVRELRWHPHAPSPVKGSCPADLGVGRGHSGLLVLMVGTGAGVHTAEVLGLHIREQREEIPCFLMLPRGRIYSKVEPGQRESSPGVGSLHELSGERRGWNTKPSDGEDTDTSCGNAHLLNWTPTSLWLYFISIPEHFIFLPFVRKYGVCSQSLSRVWLFVTPWTVARQAPLSMGFPRQEYWSGLPVASPGDLPDPGIELTSSASQVDSLPLSHLGSP